MEPPGFPSVCTGMSLGRSLHTFALASVLACAVAPCALDAAPTPPGSRATIEKDETNTPSALRAAKDEARRSGKDILVVMNVSDWGSWCEKLREEVISHPEFVADAQKDFVLVELDYPQKRRPDNEDEHRRAVDFAAKYHVTGFPVVLLLDSNGAAYARTGYTGNSPKDYVGHIREMRDVRVRRDSLILKAFRNKGDIRAVLLGNALRTIDGSLTPDYPELFEELRRVDPWDRTRAIIDYDISLLQLRANRLSQLSGDPATGLWEYDAFLAAHPGLEKGRQQRVRMLRHAQKLRMVDRSDSPIAFRERLAEELAEILALDPKSTHAPQLRTYLDGNANHLIRLKEEAAKREAEHEPSAPSEPSSVEPPAPPVEATHETAPVAERAEDAKLRDAREQNWPRTAEPPALETEPAPSDHPEASAGTH